MLGLVRRDKGRSVLSASPVQSKPHQKGRKWLEVQITIAVACGTSGEI